MHPVYLNISTNYLQVVPLAPQNARYHNRKEIRKRAYCLQIPANLTAKVPFHHNSEGMIEGIDGNIDIIASPLVEPPLVCPVVVIGRTQISQLIRRRLPTVKCKNIE